MNENELVELAVFSVPECNLEHLKSRIAKLNKRAAKVKSAPVELAVEFDAVKAEYVNKHGDKCWVPVGEEMSSVWKSTGSKMAFYNITVNGKTPKFDGWSFVATLEMVTTDDGVTENLIKTIPGAVCPAEYSKKVGTCDHCKKHRKRSETFVVKHDNGEYKAVGRNCTADFLGGADPQSIVNQATWLIEINEACGDSEIFEGGFGGGKTGDILVDLLTWTASLIDLQGWKSKASCEFGGIPTVSLAQACLTKHPNEPKEITALRCDAEPKPEHLATAEAAVAWAAGFCDEEVENNNYLQNCRLVAKCEWCSDKNAGIAASIVAAYLKHLDQLKLAAKKAARPPSKHVGAIKQRLVHVVTCEKVIKIEGMYGLTGIHKMVDEHGNDLVWFASGSAEWLDVDGTYEVKATVVKHDEYQGRAQTQVNRVTILKEIDPATGEAFPIKSHELEPEVKGEKVW